MASATMLLAMWIWFSLRLRSWMTTASAMRPEPSRRMWRFGSIRYIIMWVNIMGMRSGIQPIIIY